MKVTFSSSLRFILLLLTVLALPLASSFARNDDDTIPTPLVSGETCPIPPSRQRSASLTLSLT